MGNTFPHFTSFRLLKGEYWCSVHLYGSHWSPIQFVVDSLVSDINVGFLFTPVRILSRALCMLVFGLLVWMMKSQQRRYTESVVIVSNVAEPADDLQSEAEVPDCTN